MKFACVLYCELYISNSKTILLIYSISFSSKTNATGDGNKPSNLKNAKGLSIGVDTGPKKCDVDLDSGAKNGCNK